MIAIDTNILVYAHRRETRFHQAAADFLSRCAEGRESWAIPWPCCYEFFSVVTNPRIWKTAASTPDQAKDQLDAWADSPSIKLIGETPGFMKLLDSVLRQGRVRGANVHDARVAAICLTHGVERLATADRDFSQFPDLPRFNPLDRA